MVIRSCLFGKARCNFLPVILQITEHLQVEHRAQTGKSQTINIGVGGRDVTTLSSGCGVRF